MTAPSRSHGQRVEVWHKMCLSKRRFPDEYVARAAIQSGMQNGSISTDKLYVYQCPSCRGWHMTHKNHGEKTHSVTPQDPFHRDVHKPKRNYYLRAR